MLREYWSPDIVIVLVAIIVLGSVFTGLWNQETVEHPSVPSPQSQDGSPEAGSVVVRQGSISTKSPSSTQAVDSQSPPKPNDKPADAIDVLIDGQTYFFRPVGGEKYRPVELSELIRKAKQARGDKGGTRVRIARRKTSRASAEKLLVDELTKAGLPRNSVSWQKDLVDGDALKEFTQTASGLKYRIRRKSDGKKPTAADTVNADYRGWIDDGTVFDTSFARGAPATFPLNRVIKVWTEGLQRGHD